MVSKLLGNKLIPKTFASINNTVPEINIYIYTILLKNG
jgi:hypothetical protein